VLLKFQEDSPDYRQKVNDLGENVEGLRKTIQRMVDFTRRYGKTGQVYGDLGRRLAEEMMGGGDGHHSKVQSVN
jgi:hypothetical protein